MTHADNKTDDSEITNVPKHKVGAYLRYTLFEKLVAQIDTEYDSKRFSSADRIQVADGYVVANTKVGYDIGNGFWVDAGVKNLFDENLRDPGRLSGSRKNPVCQSSLYLLMVESMNG